MSPIDRTNALSPLEVQLILKAAPDLKDGYLIGGQALSMWAEYFIQHGCAVLANHGPFVSKDVDYFSDRHTAERFAAKLGGTLLTPEPSSQTPNTAVVTLMMGQKTVVIDFLGFIKGLRENDLKRFPPLEIEVPEIDGEGEQQGSVIVVPILHPVLCLQSRVGNVMGLRRTDARSIDQLRASITIVREYISWSLANGDRREAKRCVRAVFEYTRSDILGSKVYSQHGINLMEAIDLNDARFDDRYREKTLRAMFLEIERRRGAQATQN
jgi:hypothetical protein